MSLLPVADAQARLLALAAPLPLENMPLNLALGRYLAEPLAALRNQPASDLSAMDGYAIRFADLPGPWRCIGESAAGVPFPGNIGTGEAARIFTGAVMPDGTDTVLLQENVAVDGACVTITCDPPAQPRQHVRLGGSDFAYGQLLLPCGRRIGPAELALVAMGGHASISAGGQPRIAIVATGDELRTPGTPLGPGQIPSSNNLMIAAMLAGEPCLVSDQGILADRMEALVAEFCALDADIIVTIGGVSVGDHDLVRPALEAAGGAIDFWKVAMKPGKPLLAGRLGDALVLGLPGNPGSAFVTALLFLLPLVRRLAGAGYCLPPSEQFALSADLPAGGQRAEYLHAVREAGAVRPLPRQDSGMVATLAQADGLIVQPPDAPPRQAGEPVLFIPIR